MLSSDLDVMEEALDGFRGPLKIQLCGPWTLAATLELPRTLNVAIADPGAVADLTASLAEGAAAHVAEIAKRVPGAHLVVQFDEPALPAVAGGEVPTASGLSRTAPRRGRDATRAAGPGDRRHREVHRGAQLRSRAVPFGLIRAAGADAVSFDLSQLRRGEGDEVAEAAEAGMGLLTGVVPPLPAPDPRAGRSGPSGPDRNRSARVTAAPRPGRRPSGSSGSTSGWGCRWPRCPQQAVITPACGLAGASPDQARAALTQVPRGGEHAG